MMEFTFGLFAGLGIWALANMVGKGRELVAAIDSFEDPEAMTHAKLAKNVAMFCPIVTLTGEQVADLVDEFHELNNLFEEAMLRKEEMHREVGEMARVASRLQDELGTALLESDHCRATCDELRDKLSAKDVVAVEVKGVIDFADAAYETGELCLTDAEWLKSFAVEYTHNIHVCEAEKLSAKAGA